MSATTKHKLEFAFAMARHTKATVRQCEALMRYAGTLQRLEEDYCNIPMNDAEIARREAKMARIRGKVHGVCMEIAAADANGKFLNIAPIFSGDPRGCVLKIRVPDGFSDDFGGEGICVPA
jgi:hypothetical protein